MTSRMLRTALHLALVLGAFLAGLSIGNRTMWHAAIRMFTSETQGHLSQRIETLARLRTGDADGAIALLEQAVDTATETPPQGRPWSEVDPDLRLTLQMAKAYRQRYPPERPSAALTALLETIPMPEVQYCSTAMQELLRSAAQ